MSEDSFERKNEGNVEHLFIEIIFSSEAFSR